MTTLIVLSDADVQELLHFLTRDDVLAMQHSLAEALHTYSTGTQDQTCASQNQPASMKVRLRGGLATHFTPASTGDNVGMKIETLAECSSGTSTSTSSRPPPETPPPPASFSSSSSSAASTVSSFSSTTASIPSTQASSTTPPLAGTLTLLSSSSGLPIGVLNTRTLTPFRTALAASLLFSRRTHTSTITIFGAGALAYWHIHLSLLLRPASIKHIHIINRTFARAQPLLEELYGPLRATLRGATKISVLSAEYADYALLLKEQVRKADVLFCTTPALEPLFPPEHLTSLEGRRKGRLVSAVGGRRAGECEVHPDVLRLAVAPGHGHHHHKHAAQGGVVVVDSLDACMRDAGEILQAGLRAEQLVEVGELVMLKRQAGGEGVEELTRWLAEGNVVFKGMGMGLMDVVVGSALLRIAGEKGVGTRVEGF
ncbi:MAG: hypothetical protein M1829_003320 [Trizodia sp. TS-e1964]|nr:MAG: hypothetical protein M1829_003320 [Trizodia sp. TS-e1964]